MNTSIRYILLPVQLDTASLSVARQAAEFAAKHNADLHLLHIADMKECQKRFFNLFTRSGANDYHRITRQKTDMLNTWKRWLGKEYNINVSTTVDWGNWKKNILKHAEETGADLIALAEDPKHTKRTFFKISPLEQIIEKSPCQVITFFPGRHSMQEWKQVVIPVTRCIPVTRIQTIVDVAKQLSLKIHLVTMSGREIAGQASDFYFLTETLKRLKPAGNIQVECRCLKNESNPVSGFISYARSIGADLLMTNIRSNTDENPRPKESFYFMEYA